MSTAVPAFTSSTSHASSATWSTSPCTARARTGLAVHGEVDQVAELACEVLDVNATLATFSTDLTMAAATESADIVHSHTWYTNLAGHLAAILHAIPHVMTVHSLEPLRPWKAEQLGGGYALSSWCERVAIESAAAVIAVSNGMRADVLDTYPHVDPGRLHVIRNGIDTDQYSPDQGTDVLANYGIDPDRPTVAFVGRITRQKGLPI